MTFQHELAGYADRLTDQLAPPNVVAHVERQLAEATQRRKAGVLVYHGTIAQHGPGIVAHGLTSSAPNPRNVTSEGPWVTTEIVPGVLYAVRAVAVSLGPDVFGDLRIPLAGVVFALKVPQRSLRRENPLGFGAQPIGDEYAITRPARSQILGYATFDVAPMLRSCPVQIRASIAA